MHALCAFPRRKFLLALRVLGAGMAASCLWHGVQGWVLHRGYPFDTFLYLPERRFGDFTEVMRAALLPDPYADAGSYFPFAYLFLRPFAALDAAGAGLFWAVSVGGTLRLLASALTAVVPGRGRGALLALLFAALLYPFWFCLDRGNVEMLLALLVAAFLRLLAAGRPGLALLPLVPAICFKGYPVVLLALYLLLGRLKWIAAGLLASVAVTWTSLLAFAGSCAENARLLQAHLAKFTYDAVLHNAGLGDTATPWNALKLLVKFVHQGPHPAPGEWNADLVRVLSPTLRAYSLAMAGAGLLLALHVAFVERILFRRAALLLIYLVVASPAGADYKLLHAAVALILLILIPERRRGDLAAVALLAFALIPKKELLLPALGLGNSRFRDISIGIFLTPSALIAAGIVLAWGGWEARDPGWTRRRIGNVIPFLRRAVE